MKASGTVRRNTHSQCPQDWRKTTGGLDSNAHGTAALIYMLEVVTTNTELAQLLSPRVRQTKTCESRIATILIHVLASLCQNEQGEFSFAVKDFADARESLETARTIFKRIEVHFRRIPVFYVR